MNFHESELNVSRWAEANGKLTECTPGQQGMKTITKVCELYDAMCKGNQVEVSEQMGRVAIDMIVLCAMLDIDLAKSLETAFNKISAKPVDTSNVVLLKRDQS